MIKWRYRVGISAAMTTAVVRGPYRFTEAGDTTSWEAVIQDAYATPLKFSWVAAESLADAVRQASQLIEGRK